MQQGWVSQSSVSHQSESLQFTYLVREPAAIRSERAHVCHIDSTRVFWLLLCHVQSCSKETEFLSQVK